MATLKHYFDYPLKKGSKISFFETNLAIYKLKDSDTYKFTLDFPIAAKFIICKLLGRGRVEGKETIDFEVIEAKNAE
jgi:hypothetical protein